MGAATAEKSRTLIIFPGALGDLICLIPAIKVIAERHPESALELMARFELARFAVGRLGISCAHSIDRAEVAQLFAEPRAETPATREFFAGFERIYSFVAADQTGFRQALGAVALEVSFHPVRPLGDDHVAAAYLR